MTPHERWTTFLQKVASRADEVLAEAGPGLDELIATEVMDPVPLSSALAELHARLLGLEKKIDDGWEKIDAEEPADRDALLELGRTTRRSIARKSRELQVRKQADAVRKLLERAQAEMRQLQQSMRCSSCGAPVAPTVLHQPSNVTCAHCKAVSVVRPGMATLMFFQGVGPHALAEEAALDERARLEAAELRYQALRKKRKADVAAWVQAHREYWLVYARGYGRHLPGWSDEQARTLAEAKLGGLKLELDSVRTVD